MALYEGRHGCEGLHEGLHGGQWVVPHGVLNVGQSGDQSEGLSVGQCEDQSEGLSVGLSEGLSVGLSVGQSEGLCEVHCGDQCGD